MLVSKLVLTLIEEAEPASSHDLNERFPVPFQPSVIDEQVNVADLLEPTDVERRAGRTVEYRLNTFSSQHSHRGDDPVCGVYHSSILAKGSDLNGVFLQ